MRHKCIGRGQVCDGKRNCPGGDDEKDCDNETGSDPFKEAVTGLDCSEEEFQCLHNRKAACLSNERRCNGIKDCDNGEDETECPALKCFDGYWLCGDGSRCVSQIEWCNGVKDCRDNSDEMKCFLRMKECQPGEWRCKNGRGCILQHYKCDGFSDCWDGSDESPKTCIEA